MSRYYVVRSCGRYHVFDSYIPALMTVSKSVADYANESSAAFACAALNTYHKFTVSQLSQLIN